MHLSAALRQNPAASPRPAHHHSCVQLACWHRLCLPIYLMLAMLLGACTSLPKEVARPVSTALTHPASTRIGQAVAARAATAGTRNDSGFALVSNAELAFTSRMTLIKTAQKTQIGRAHV